MSDIDARAAAELSQAMGFTNQAPAEQAAPVEPASQSPVEPAATETPSTGEDSFTSIDPTSLPPQLQHVYKSMQADYTRKNQAIAEQRKQFDTIGGFEQAQQAVQFAQALNTDPDFALRVHSQLSQSLQAAGLTPAQAQAEATRQVQEAATDDMGLGESDEGSSPLERELAELKNWRATVERERQEHIYANELNRQEMVIRQANPSYTDDDFANIYSLSYATEGNLIAAEQAFRGMRDRMIASYMDQKGATPAAIAPGVANAAQQPVKFESLDEADKAARAMLLAAGFSL